MFNIYVVKKIFINEIINWFFLYVSVKEVIKNNVYLCIKKREIRCFFLVYVKI